MTPPTTAQVRGLFFWQIVATTLVRARETLSPTVPSQTVKESGQSVTEQVKPGKNQVKPGKNQVKPGKNQVKPGKNQVKPGKNSSKSNVQASY